MTIETLEEEVVRLRAELAAIRAQELLDVKAQLAEAKHAVVHYRAEAQRNADIGRQIAASYQQQIVELQAKVEALERIDSHVRRFGTERGG